MFITEPLIVAVRHGSGGAPLGNIRPTYIKRVAIELLKRFPDEFKDDYQHNKQKVSELSDVRSPGMRNKIAGYVTRYRQVLLLQAR